MAIKNSVSNDFLSLFVESIDVFDCRLPGSMMGDANGTGDASKYMMDRFMYHINMNSTTNAADFPWVVPGWSIP